ncbi:MAG: hypothetical protein MRZ59_05445 [Clostridiales bacterium]|nr:hypothetical protein [Clostridiales bacterium]MDY3746649.1 hypothetical protein [Lachnospiraceae bacterium]
MKFRSVDEFDTFQFKDATVSSIKFTENQLIIEAEGVIVKSDNSNNTRFEDMYCVLLELKLNQFKLFQFVEQGYKYYDVSGKLLDVVPDRPLDHDEQTSVLEAAAGAYLFRLEKSVDTEGYELIFDIEGKEDDELTKTYQINFDFNGSIASWDRFSGPVNG